MLLRLYNKKLLMTGLLLLFGCSFIPALTYSNFMKIQKDMSEQAVLDLLGEPTEVTSVNVDTGIIGSLLGMKELSGTNMIWKTPQAKANVLFVGGKVRSSNFTNQF